MGSPINYQIKPRPVDNVQAMQWDGTEESAMEIKSWFDKAHGSGEYFSYFEHIGQRFIMIKSGHLSMTARDGDYIVRSSKQRSEPKKFSVYRKDAFEAGFFEVATKPVLTNDQASAALRHKLKLGV